MSGDCQETCGNNVSIPYPFGIGKGCYFPNSWFEVTCNKSKPFLKRLNLELLHSYSDSIVVNNPVIYFNCGGNNNNGKSEVDNNVTAAAGAFTHILAGSPFSFSSANSFGSAGYGGNLATIFSNQIPISGCLQPGFGNGNYCYIGEDTPENLAYLGAKMTQIIFPGAQESNRCSSAFIFDQSTVYYSDVLPRVSIDIETRHVPARLDWNTTGLRCDLSGPDCKEPGAPDRVVCNESRCGDVVIEFPFGTKAGCYMNEWFKVTCNKTG
ncbi:hypothetical protein CCACVL1_04129 [Corchorus capsularis]|uniref:Wall-associated receptor kinase galacturonan-binding domain-containing protein n=1 Tax=Corchorus capsularis TaxID=210143 RepID=A0A1R3JV74_COCAP|nr:hypothetical protein CCACVL1_04129 [Corchorus capsularis]